MASKIYPTKSDYATAINNPKIAFRKKNPQTQAETDLDPILVNGESFKVPHPSNPNIKQPWSASGGFACVFKYQTFYPNKFWAVRCFNQSTSTFDIHYKKVSQRLKNISCTDYFIDFTFLDEGIRVNGNIYPLLRMEWVEGKDLKTFIKDNLSNQNRLLELAEAWLKLSEDLYNAGIAHGDLQHGNILIDEHNNTINIKLIDYDSLYFIQDGNNIYDEIKGLAGYQHPLRDALQNQCLQIDFFPQWVIFISIMALAEEPKLWQTYNLDNTERLLFCLNDFKNPYQAKIFDDLSTLSLKVTDIFRKICQVTDFEDIPCLAIALQPDDPIDITNIFINSVPKPPVNPQPGGTSTSVDVTSTFTASSQQPRGSQPKSNSSSQPVDTTNIFTKSQNGSSFQNRLIPKLQSENRSLTVKVDQLNKRSNVLSKLAIVSTIIATTLAGLSLFQYYERNQIIKQIEQLRKQNNLSFGQWKLSSYSLELELDNFSNIINGRNPLISFDLDELVKEMQKKTNDNIGEMQDKIDEQSQQIQNLTQDRDFYNTVLSGFPYKIPPNSSVDYRGYLGTQNNKSNAIFYRIYVPVNSKFNISLLDMTADGDFEIRRIDGSLVEGSTRNSSSTSSEELNNFSLNAGAYDIKVWNYNSSNSTSYTLHIYNLGTD